MTIHARRIDSMARVRSVLKKMFVIGCAAVAVIFVLTDFADA